MCYLCDMATSHNPQDTAKGASETRTGFGKRLFDKAVKAYDYVVSGIWSDTRQSWWVNILKTISLSLRSFFNTDLQMRAAALTFQTILAIVPALALIFAIGRGFGFQNLLQTQMFSYFPAQRQAMETAFSFVDSYLSQSSEGIFVGIGIVFLLWTLISLLSTVEDAFNKVWGIPRGRSMWRKITDYTAIFLILPILMICSSGITVLMSTTLQTILPKYITDGLGWVLDLASLVLICLFFAGTYMLVPNTKVKFGNAILAGTLAGIAFTIVQWLFVTGQVYVTRYNAIYGSFAFLPLLLLWLQLVWIITLSGAVLCYSSQNIFEFSFTNKITNISDTYRWKITFAVLSVVVQRFVNGEKAMTDRQISTTYQLPISLVSATTNRLIECGLLQRVQTGHNDSMLAVAPATDPTTLTMGDVIKRVGECGTKDFIPNFSHNFNSIINIADQTEAEHYACTSKIPLTSLKPNHFNLKQNENPDCN